MTKAVLHELSHVPRVPLLAARPVPGPGIYGIWWGSRRAPIVDLLGESRATGRRISYCGSSGSDLRARVGRYRQLLGELPGVDLDEIWVGTLPCRSRAGALYAEAVVLSSCRPLLNELGAGLGSMRPGSGRRGQKAAVIDALFPPGRCWSRPPSLVEQIRARCQLLASLARTDPAGPHWPSLVP